MDKEICNAILSQTKPFCLIDIQRRLNQYDPGLVLRNLDELDKCGFINYGEYILEDGEKIWAFSIKDEGKPKKLINKSR